MFTCKFRFAYIFIIAINVFLSAELIADNYIDGCFPFNSIFLTIRYDKKSYKGMPVLLNKRGATGFAVFDGSSWTQQRWSPYDFPRYDKLTDWIDEADMPTAIANIGSYWFVVTQDGWGGDIHKYKLDGTSMKDIYYNRTNIEPMYGIILDGKFVVLNDDRKLHWMDENTTGNEYENNNILENYTSLFDDWPNDTKYFLPNKGAFYLIGDPCADRLVCRINTKELCLASGENRKVLSFGDEIVGVEIDWNERSIEILLKDSSFYLYSWDTNFVKPSLMIYSSNRQTGKIQSCFYSPETNTFLWVDNTDTIKYINLPDWDNVYTWKSPQKTAKYYDFYSDAGTKNNVYALGFMDNENFNEDKVTLITQIIPKGSSTVFGNTVFPSNCRVDSDTEFFIATNGKGYAYNYQIATTFMWWEIAHNILSDTYGSIGGALFNFIYKP